jgi:hypothetical protein
LKMAETQWLRYVKGPTLLLTPLLTNPLNSSTKLQKQHRFQN